MVDQVLVTTNPDGQKFVKLRVSQQGSLRCACQHMKTLVRLSRQKRVGSSLRLQLVRRAAQALCDQLHWALLRLFQGVVERPEGSTLFGVPRAHHAAASRALMERFLADGRCRAPCELQHAARLQAGSSPACLPSMPKRLQVRHMPHNMQQRLHRPSRTLPCSPSRCALSGFPRWATSLPAATGRRAPSASPTPRRTCPGHRMGWCPTSSSILTPSPHA